MDILPILADLSIRRACGFAALAIGTVMLALSYDMALALRSGAILASLVCGVVWAMAWGTPLRDIRRTELWSMLAAERRHLTLGPDAPRLRALASRVLRDRLVWHGERIAVAALALWACTGAVLAYRMLLPG